MPKGCEGARLGPHETNCIFLVPRNPNPFFRGFLADDGMGPGIVAENFIQSPTSVAFACRYGDWSCDSAAIRVFRLAFSNIGRADELLAACHYFFPLHCISYSIATEQGSLIGHVFAPIFPMGYIL